MVVFILFNFSESKVDRLNIKKIIVTAKTFRHSLRNKFLQYKQQKCLKLFCLFLYTNLNVAFPQTAVFIEYAIVVYTHYYLCNRCVTITGSYARTERQPEVGGC